MNQIKVKITSDTEKEGILHHFDIETNRVFVEMDGEYSWLPFSSVICDPDMIKIYEYRNRID